jgi:ABC-type phosphate/phosphonate transport system substrate-binding protein
MGTASLPMYDLPEVRGAGAALWAGIAQRLRRDGVAEVPDALVHDRAVAELWADPDLLFSQCCGADLALPHGQNLQPLATPFYRAPGCTGPRYSSLIVVSERSPARALEDLRGARCVINEAHSRSGATALWALVAPLGGRGFFREVVLSGAHVESLALVAGGEVDVAAIDCITHALLARHRAAALAGTRPLCHSPAALAPPFVTRANASPELVAQLRAALQGALEDPDLAAARDDLLLAGIEIQPAAAYLDLAAAASDPP